MDKQAPFNFKGYGPSGLSYIANSEEWTKQHKGKTVLVIDRTDGANTGAFPTVLVTGRTIYNLSERGRVVAGYADKRPALEVLPQ